MFWLTSLYSQIHFHWLVLWWKMKEAICPYAFVSPDSYWKLSGSIFLTTSFLLRIQSPFFHKGSVFYLLTTPPPWTSGEADSYPQDLWVLLTPVTLSQPSSHRGCFRGCFGISAKPKANEDQWNLITRLWFNLSGLLDMKKGGDRVWSCCGLGMERLKAVLLTCWSPGHTPPVYPGLFHHMRQKILIATESILTEGIVIWPFRWSTVSWISLFR